MNQAKLASLRALMNAQGCETCVIQRSQNFAWLTDGAASYINIASDTGAAAVVVTAERAVIVCDNIELPRLRDEEELSGWEFSSGPWTAGRGPLIAALARGRVCADSFLPGATDINPAIAGLRYALDPQEIERMRIVGAATARAIERAARAIQPGMSEFEISGLIAREAYAEQLAPIVNLVAADERCFRYRHPLPTTRTLEKYVMLVICGRRWGLIGSATRLVHFGPAPAELRRKTDACAEVDAAFIGATRRGATLAEVLHAGQVAYAQHGFDGEWQRHHQGGLTGYQTREALGTPGAGFTINANHAFAWNPSIAGAKSEDTILLTDAGVEVVTATGDWPQIRTTGIARPDILVR